MLIGRKVYNSVDMKLLVSIALFISCNCTICCFFQPIKTPHWITTQVRHAVARSFRLRRLCVIVQVVCSTATGCTRRPLVLKSGKCRGIWRLSGNARVLNVRGKVLSVKRRLLLIHIGAMSVFSGIMHACYTVKYDVGNHSSNRSAKKSRHVGEVYSA